jgi:hypothetical protein
MSDNTSVMGELGQCDHPNWEPLLARVGEPLVAEFMWMSEIELADGVAVHAYKHIATRRYLHLAEDGRTLTFTRSGRYRPIDPYDALVTVFDDWERLAGDRPDVEELRAALRQAYKKALGT